MPTDPSDGGDFERLLAWLSPDREEAGKTYERIRQNLLTYFRRQGASDPLSLADEVIIRVTKKVNIIAPDFVGDPAHYFLGVARYVLSEWRRQPTMTELPEDISTPSDSEKDAFLKELSLQGLEHCWTKLSPSEQDILSRYYDDLPAQKLYENREQLARELGQSINALRVMTHRLRGKVGHCIEKFVEKRLK